MNYEQIGEQILAITERYKVPSILYNSVFTSRDLIPRTKYQYWVGSVTPDDEEAGVHLAEQLLLKAKKRKLEQINMLVINGNMKEISAQQRNQGLHQFIKHNPNISIVAETEAGVNWSRSESKHQFMEYYRKHPEINMVWAASDNLGLGVKDAIEELSLPKDTILVGSIDWQPEALQTIKKQPNYISVGGHFTEAAWGIVLLKDYLQGNDFVSESTQFHTQMYPITHQNIKMFQSFTDDNWQRIDFNELSKERNSEQLYNFSIKYLLDTHYQNTKALKLTEEELQWLKQHDTFRLAIDIDWPPFEFVNELGVYQGMSADYIKLVAERLGVELRPSINMSWSEVVEAAKRRELDMYPALAITPERKSYLKFTRPYLSFPMMIITNQDIPFIGDIDALNDAEVAIVKGYASHEMLRENHPRIKLFEAKTVSEALEAVSSGKVKAYVGNIATANYVIRRDGFTHLKISGATPYHFDLSMAVRSDWPILHTILQKALDSLSENEKNIIYSRWVTLRYDHGFDYSLVWKVIAISIVLLVFLSYWTKKLSNLNLKLNSEIAERKVIEEQLRQEKKKIEKLSITDPLTGLYNRRHYNKVLPDEIRRAQRSNDWLSFVILDVDSFKQYNDNYGHHNGDSQLIDIAKTLKSHCHRASDYCFRLGGEEFGIIFSSLSPEEAAAFVERLRAAIEHLQIEHKHSCVASVVTASFGLVTTNASNYEIEQLYEAADTALYKAKNSGRNRVEASVLFMEGAEKS
ncbi:diguanylate cyclase [Vibrio marisflavi]|uniref:Autoinducer 2-binding periplasmic protein LuxP n=1 Tax=Vibrio marisflavi CECT 7928 TaxID=634439 RepID=A0ABN8DZM5_9VIBR|nr:Membrane-bound lytic murein transglycosylase F [Vibrio marisflavi CECT 7928]